MKTLISKYWLVLMALVSVTLFTACSSDDDAVTPVFPQVKTIGGAAGAELDFTFDANESWSLSSDKIWCKLVQGEKTDAFVLNGTAGKQTIKVKITGDDASDDMSVAQLFLNMGGQKVAIAEVKRSAADHILTVYDADGNDITKTGITVGYNVYTKFTVKSNFRFAVTNTPAWVDLEGGFLVGTPNKDAVGGVAFKENQGVSAKYAIAKDGNYTITFTSEDGKAAVTVPVIYNGMTTSTMDVTYPTSSQWAVWNVSLDGKVFTQNGSSLNGGETNDFTFYTFVPFTLKTLGDAYQLVVFEKKEDGLREETSGAVKLQGEKGDVKLTVAPLGSGIREFLVYALPQSVFESLENGLDGMLEEDFMTVKSDYDRYFLMDVVQKEEKKGDSEVTAPIVTSMGMEADCALTTNEEFKSYAEGIFSYTGKEVFESTVYGGYVAIYPQIDGWDPTAGAKVVIYDGTGNPVDVKNYEVGQDDKGIYVGLNADKLTYPILAGFTDMQRVCQRVVIINNMGFRSKRK
ncbi:DUF5003 domain-containing protein [Segatella copri]|uniref:DUF5003 domain-containing protein n=1 Tax=Segatella copri TaxID=165179 RepID=UPI001862A68B|nr:DUF5003 domain-containing protein [Segatella copri]MBM0155517.1 DUF5003 domain-containing protein [Segatella copri]QNT67449.1 DUF5003 domain-containing protein [Segatella copri]